MNVSSDPQICKTKGICVLKGRVYGEKLSANSLHSSTCADYTLNGRLGKAEGHGCQVAGLPGCQVVGLSACRLVGLPCWSLDCQVPWSSALSGIGATDYTHVTLPWWEKHGLPNQFRVDAIRRGFHSCLLSVIIQPTIELIRVIFECIRLIFECIQRHTRMQNGTYKCTQTCLVTCKRLVSDLQATCNSLVNRKTLISLLSWCLYG